MKNGLKTIALMLFLATVTTSNGYGQGKFKDFLDKKKEQLKSLANRNSKQGTETNLKTPTEGQIEIATKWESGTFSSYKPDGFMMRSTGKKIQIQIIKDENGKLEGIGFEKAVKPSFFPVTRDGSTFVSAFVNNIDYLYFTDEMIVCYTVSAISGGVEHIRWVLKTKKSPSAIIAEIDAYEKYSETKILEDNQKTKGEEIAFRKENTLEGKDVTKITPIYPEGKPTSISFNESIDIGFEITLADGTTVKTSNVGGNAYIEDLVQEESFNCIISSLGKSYSSNFDGTNPKTNGRIRTKISDMDKDYISVTVKPKYKGSASFTIKLPIKYPTKVTALNSGMSGSSNNNYESKGGDGSNGSTITAKVKTIKHSQTGEVLYLCKVGSEIYKLSKGGTLSIVASGGFGGNGGPGRDASQYDGSKAPTDGGDGGNGGNGGIITLFIDPSAKDINVTYSVSGGNGGNGGIKGTCFSCGYGSDANFGKGGSGGNSGSFSKEIKKVTF
jgi:hypothetical protein